MFPLLLALLVAPASAQTDPFPELPLFHHQVYIESISEPMHWFDATFLSVEWAGCRVGIPVGPKPALERAYLGCFYPASPLDDQVPDGSEAAKAYRLARRVVIEQNPRAQSLSLRFVGTWSRVSVSDVVPLPLSHNANVQRVYEQGHALYALTDEGLKLAPPPGMWTLGGTGLHRPPAEPLHFVAVDLPQALRGTSVLALQKHDAEVLKQGELLLREAVLNAIPAYQSGTRSGPQLTMPSVLPQGVERSLTLSVSTFARPRLRRNGMPETKQLSHIERFEVPVAVALKNAVRWVRRTQDLGLELDYTLDVPGGTATLISTGPRGDTARTEWSVDLDVLADGEALYVRHVTQERTYTEPEPPRPKAREQQLEGFGPFAWVHVFSGGITQSPVPWIGGGDYSVLAVEQPVSSE